MIFLWLPGFGPGTVVLIAQSDWVVCHNLLLLPKVTLACIEPISVPCES